jgi:hypothetical protein
VCGGRLSLRSSSEVFLLRLELQNRPLAVKSYPKAALPFILSVFQGVFKFVEYIFSETDPLSLCFNVDCNYLSVEVGGSVLWKPKLEMK